MLESERISTGVIILDENGLPSIYTNQTEYKQVQSTCSHIANSNMVWSKQLRSVACTIITMTTFFVAKSEQYLRGASRVKKEVLEIRMALHISNKWNRIPRRGRGGEQGDYRE